MIGDYRIIIIIVIMIVIIIIIIIRKVAFDLSADRVAALGQSGLMER